MARKKIMIKGVLEDFWETGTEGVMWAVHEDGKIGYEGLNIIAPGDKLTIFCKDGSVLWEGEIDPDYKVGWHPYMWVTKAHAKTVFCEKARGCSKGHSVKWAKSRNLGQQLSGGRWVHWIQKDFYPSDWGDLFYENPPYRAILEKK